MDAFSIVDEVCGYAPGEALWIEAPAKGEREALKMQIWRVLKKLRIDDISIHFRENKDGIPCVVVRKKPAPKCYKGTLDTVEKPVDLRLAKLRKQMQADGLSAEEIEAILSEAKE